MSDSFGSRMGTSQTQDLVLLAGIGLGGYVLYKIFSAFSAVARGAGAAASAVASATAAGYNSVRDAVANGLFAVWGPADVSGPSIYYNVTFPDGSNHAVDPTMIYGAGYFDWSGAPAGSQAVYTYQLIKDNNGFWYAIDPG